MNTMTQFSLTPEQLKIYTKYSCLALPRHTSYPIAALWTEEVTPSTYHQHLQTVAKDKNPLSLYIHVPYCGQLCFYCACNKEILGPERLKKGDVRHTYLDYLEKEIKCIAPLLKNNPIAELHFGGGTPTFLTPEQMQRLLKILRENFNLTSDMSFSVEIDPRVTNEEQIKLLVAAGMNRVSLGVQDFDIKVQQAVNRLQSFELVENIIQMCRRNGIKSVNFDLIYGLPFQTMESMNQTLDMVFKLSPDRIAFYRLAVIPEMFKWQKSFTKVDLLKDEKLLEMNMMAINRFQKEGYRFIGLDHFAKSDELLAKSEKDGTLRRNFQGMTTGGEVAIIGFGPSAISQLPNLFAQNPKDIQDWQKRVDQGIPTERGMYVSDDDKIVQDAISQLYCHGRIDKNKISTHYKINFDDFFADELLRLKDLEQENLCENRKDEIVLEPILGRLLVRAIASVFDRHLPKDAYKVGINPTHASRLG